MSDSPKSLALKQKNVCNLSFLCLLVEWYIQENTLFFFFIISVSLISPLACQWFIEESSGNLG